tara:strand:- start:15730 stop:16035 length:306 start_codon:yes stop_codon:yes gene_type:complete
MGIKEETNKRSPDTKEIAEIARRLDKHLDSFVSSKERFNSTSPKKAVPSEAKKKRVEQLRSPRINPSMGFGNKLPTIVTINTIVAVLRVVWCLKNSIRLFL